MFKESLIVIVFLIIIYQIYLNYYDTKDEMIAKQSKDYFHSKRERITLIKYSKLKVGAEYVDSKFLD